MMRYRHMLSIFVAVLAALALMIAAPASRADNGDEEEPFEVATIYLELNDTDGDLGIHALVDGEGWKMLEIESPNEREQLKITARGSLRRHGMTELFFESAEPSFDELLPSEFFSRFQEGVWEVSGVTIEGDELESTALLSHVLAAPPENILVSGQAVPEDCDEGPVPVVSAEMPITISWRAVTDSHPEIGESGAIEVVMYQLVVEHEEPVPLKFTADLLPTVTQMQLPPGLLKPDEEIKVEVLVREANGNQTATESCFETE